MRLLFFLVAASADSPPCEFGVSSDGRFCCPAWCGKTCGGTSGDCPTTLLEEVGKHACGDFAPPCMIRAAESEDALEEERAMAEIERAVPEVPLVEPLPELDLAPEANLDEVQAPATVEDAFVKLADTDVALPERVPNDTAARIADASVEALIHAPAPKNATAERADDAAAARQTLARAGVDVALLERLRRDPALQRAAAVLLAQPEQPAAPAKGAAKGAGAPSSAANSTSDLLEAFPLKAAGRVRLDLPSDAAADAAVESEARGAVAAELAALERRAAKRLLQGRKRLWAAERARDAAAAAAAAAEAQEAELPGDGATLLAAPNVTAPPLFAKLLPDFAPVQAASQSVVSAERAWEQRDVKAVRAESATAVRHVVRAASNAAADRKRLVVALKDLDAKTDAVEATASKVKQEYAIDDVDPGLLTDLERLRGVVLVEEAATVPSSGSNATKALLAARDSFLAAETRYRLTARAVAAAELEQRTWAAAATSAALAQQRLEDALPAELNASIAAEPQRTWGERQLEATAASWRRAAAGGSRVARRELRLLVGTRKRAQEAAKAALRTNASLSVAVRVAKHALQDANATLATAFAEYNEEVDVGQVRALPAFNSSLHELAHSVRTALKRLDAVEADQAEVLNGTAQLGAVAGPLLAAADTAATANATLQTAAHALEHSVVALEQEEADAAADRVARQARLRR